MAGMVGCGGRAPQAEAVGSVTPGLEEAATAISPAPARTIGVSRVEQYWLPPMFRTPQDEAHYYLSRLADRRFITYYGESGRPWYIAAERLGRLGEPAVPLLVERLETSDPYELMLALYALQLASQDPAVMARTGGEPVELEDVLSEASNAENRAAALAWWERYGRLWQ